MKNTLSKFDDDKKIKQRTLWYKIELYRSGVIGGYRLLWVTMWASVLGFIMQVSILTIADMGFGFILIIDTTNNLGGGLNDPQLPKTREVFVSRQFWVHFLGG